MNEIEQKALALVKRFYPECRDDYQGRRLQMARAAIEQHEAFRQEVSDAIRTDVEYQIATKAPPQYRTNIVRFIIPAPKPDPLVEVMEKLGWYNAPSDADDLRAALEARGLEMRSKNDDQ